MSEFMGNLAGTYDAKEKGFVPGSASMHSCMAGHGPEFEVFEKVNQIFFFKKLILKIKNQQFFILNKIIKASNVELKPQKVGEGSMAFMFESAYLFKYPKFAIEKERLDNEYIDVIIIILIF